MKTKIVAAIIVTLFLASMLSMAFVTPARAQYVVDSYSVGLWHFDEGIGSTAADATLNNNHGTLSGGKFGNALYFDGVDDYIEVPDDPSLESPSITVEAWVKRLGSPGTYKYIISKYYAARPGGWSSYAFYTRNTGGLFFYIGYTGYYILSPDAGSGIWDGNWHHIMGTFDGSTVRLYVDGIEVGTGTTTTESIAYDTGSLFMGTYTSTGPWFFSGTIDEVRISNIARTSVDLTSAPSVDANTLALWRFDESVGTTVYDETLNDNDGTIHGAEWAGPTWTAGKFGSALLFDGVGINGNDFVNVFDSDTLDVTGSITLEAWIYINGFDTHESPRDHMYVLCKDTVANQRSYGIGVYGGTHKPFMIVFQNYGEGQFEIAQGTTTLTTGTWYHLAGTFDSSTGDVKVYLNGVEDGSLTSTLSSIFSGSADLQFGARQYPGYRAFFNGIIDEVRISNIARQPLDIDPDTLNLKSKGKWITAYVTVPGWHLLFKDTFTRTDWKDQEYGVWTVKTVDDVGQVFEAKSDGVHRGTAIFAGDTSWTNYVLEAKIWTDDTYWGLIYRADDAGTTYYDAYLNTGGYIEIWKHTDGIWGRSCLVKQTPVGGPSISANTWYKMKVVVEGNNIKVFFALLTETYTETPQAEYTDTASPYNSGRIGLLFYDISGPSTYVAHFDDVIVTDMEGAILFEDHFDWKVIDGTWAIEDGELSWISGNDRLGIILDGVTATDGIFEYKIRPWESVDYGKGMYIRYDDLTGYTYWVEIHHQKIHIYKYDAAGWRSVVSASVSYALDGSTWYTIKTAATGANLKVYFDGAEVIDYTDSSPLTGNKIGFRCWQHAHFDDVIVTTYVSEIDINKVVLYNGGNGPVSAVSDPKYEFVTDMFAYAVDIDGEGTLERLVKFDRMEVINGLGPGDYTFTVEAIQLDGTKLVYPYTIRLIKPGK